MKNATPKRSYLTMRNNLEETLPLVTILILTHVNYNKFRYISQILTRKLDLKFKIFPYVFFFVLIVMVFKMLHSVLVKHFNL